MVTGTEQRLSSGTFMNDNGAMLDGWVKDGEHWYYGRTGTMVGTTGSTANATGSTVTRCLVNSTSEGGMLRVREFSPQAV